MSTAEVPRPRPTPVEGEPQPRRATRTSRKRAAKPGPHAVKRETADHQHLEPFAAISLDPQDAPMWPAHAVIWLQAELPLHVPSSRLMVDRRHKIPAPGFLYPAVAAADRPQNLDRMVEFQSSCCQPVPPAGDLTPLGWDPRVLSAASPDKEAK